MTARRIAAATGAEVAEVIDLGVQHGRRHLRVRFGDGTRGFAKLGAAGDGGGCAAELAGLRWLAEVDGAPVPAILGHDDALLVLAWLPETPADPVAAARFGRDLARVHRAGAAAFGAPWPGWIASLPLDNTAGDAWPGWYVERRVIPYLRRAVDAGELDGADAGLVEAVAARTAELAGPAEPPSRVHGDLWGGNVLWSGGRGWLIDPAAHGGHRETDLALLDLFGVPHLDRIRAAYQEEFPLSAGWPARVPLHQIHPLLVHVCLFGAVHVPGLRAAARAALRG